MHAALRLHHEASMWILNVRKSEINTLPNCMGLACRQASPLGAKSTPATFSVEMCELVCSSKIDCSIPPPL